MKQQGSADESELMEQTLKDLLQRDEIQQAIITAVDKLPKFLSELLALESLLDFGSQVLRDNETMNALLEGLKSDLPDVSFNYETLQAAATLINKLPKLAHYVEVIEPLADFAENVLTDTSAIDGLADGARDLINPVRRKIETSKSLLDDAKSRAAKETSSLGLFSVLKLMKDPTVQSGLKLLKSALEVVEERKHVAV